MALKYKHIALCSLLLEYEVDIAGYIAPTGENLIHQAAMRGSVQGLSFLLHNGADINCRTRVFKHTPLIFATTKSHHDVDVSAVMPSLDTVLMVWDMGMRCVISQHYLSSILISFPSFMIDAAKQFFDAIIPPPNIPSMTLVRTLFEFGYRRETSFSGVVDKLLLLEVPNTIIIQDSIYALLEGTLTSRVYIIEKLFYSIEGYDTYNLVFLLLSCLNQNDFHNVDQTALKHTFQAIVTFYEDSQHCLQLLSLFMQHAPS